jgi:hypothetical protein
METNSTDGQINTNNRIKVKRAISVRRFSFFSFLFSLLKLVNRQRKSTSRMDATLFDAPLPFLSAGPPHPGPASQPASH